MSKRDEDSQSDLEVGMTTAERRRRRRRGGGLRVPSDAVPRRTSPPVVAPVPEDPALAMSIAYSFSSDGSEPVPKLSAHDLAHDPATSTGPFAPIAPDAAVTDPSVDLPMDAEGTEIEVAPVADDSFETKTREMSAVDLDALGLSELVSGSNTPASSSPPPAAGSPAAGSPAAFSIRVATPAADAAPTMPPAASGASGTFSIRPSTELDAVAPAAAGESSVTIDPSLYGVVEVAVDESWSAPPVTDADVADVADVETTLETAADEPTTIQTLEAIAPPTRPSQPAMPPPSPPPGRTPPLRAQTSPPPLPRAQTAQPFDAADAQPPARTSSPKLVPPGAVTAQSLVAVTLPPTNEPDAAPPPTPPTTDGHAPARPQRFATMALNEDDIEEIREAARVIRRGTEPVTSTAPPPPTTTPTALAAEAAAAPPPSRRTETLSIPDIEEMSDVPERNDSNEGSGEIVVDVDDAVEVSPPTPPPEAPRRPASVPPPIGNPMLAGNLAAVVTAAAAKAPAPPAPAKAPPAPPPAKKVAPPPPAASRTATADSTGKVPRGKPWFVDLFDEDYLRTLPFLTPQATQAEAEFVMEAMGLAAGAQVLDVGCGYGRHAMELAARGMHVAGLDLSTPLLVRGGEEAHRRGLTINFIRGDMRELDFDGQFDGAYCLFSTFGYFDDETNKKTASNIARALRPGGKVLIEILNRDYVIADLPTRVWWEGDGCVVLEEVELNYFSSRIQVNRSVVFDDGRQLEQEISVRAYSLHEVGKLMHSAGFRVLEVSGGYQTRGRFFGNQSRHIIVLAERTATPPR